MSARLGHSQLALLQTLGNPRYRMIGRDRVADSLVRRGLLCAASEDGKVVRITPDGLRTLADTLEHGTEPRP